MAAIDPNKAWALFMSDPADFILMFAATIGAVAWFVWWFRGFIHKERMLLSDDRVEKAQAEAKQISEKLAETERGNAELVRQIEISATPATLLANAASTSVMLGELRIVSDNLRTTLTFGGTRAATVLPKSIIDEST